MTNVVPFFVGKSLSAPLMREWEASARKNIAARFNAGPPAFYSIRTTPDIANYLLITSSLSIKAYAEGGGYIIVKPLEREETKKTVGAKNVGHFKGTVVMPDITDSDAVIKSTLGQHFMPHMMAMLDARPLFDNESGNYLFKWAFEFKPLTNFSARNVTASAVVNLGGGFAGKFEPCKDLVAALLLCPECLHSVAPGAKMIEACVCGEIYRLRGHQIAARRQDKDNKRKGFDERMAAFERKSKAKHSGGSSNDMVG